MEIKTAIDSLSALAHESRLAVFRYLVRRGPKGAAAGDIGREFGLPGATLNFHLEQLVSAGLVRRERQGRSINYAAVYPAMDALMDYLTRNCCTDDPSCGSSRS